MRLTCEDILEHEDDVFKLRTNDQDCDDNNFYDGMLKRFVHTFEPDNNVAIDLLQTARELQEKIQEEKDEENLGWK